MASREHGSLDSFRGGHRVWLRHVVVVGRPA